MTVYYVDITTGDNGDDGLSEGNAWATLVFAESQIGSGDHVYVKATADYQEELAMSVNPFTGNDAVTYEGYTSIPGDGGRAVIDAESTRASCISGSTISRRIFKNFECKNGTADGVECSQYCYFENVWSHDNANHGFDPSSYAIFQSCRAYDNGQYGFDLSLAGQCLFCEAHDNTLSQIHMGSLRGIVAFCKVYGIADNASYGGINSTVSDQNCLVMFNTLDGENGTNAQGIRITGGGPGVVVVNNVIFNCGKALIGNADADARRGQHWDHNGLYNNNANYTDADAGPNDITSVTNDPFLDSASHDYRLQWDGLITKSPIGAGRDLDGPNTGVDIGCLQQLAHVARLVGAGGAV